MTEPLQLGLPELACIAMAVRIIASVAFLRYGEPPRDATGAERQGGSHGAIPESAPNRGP